MDAKVRRLQGKVDELEHLAGEARALKVELSERDNAGRVKGALACPTAVLIPSVEVKVGGLH
jgi:hypothetical protein